MIMKEWAQVLFNDPIEDFRLAICLWVVRRAHTEFGSTQAE